MVSCAYPTSDRWLDAFVLDPGSDIPEAVRHKAALLLADTLAVGLGACRLEVSRIARDMAVDFMGVGPNGQKARILGDSRHASAVGAAYAAATTIDNLDAHDGYNPVKGHIGCAVVPALLAMAELLPALTGRQAINAMVIAYEIAARAGTALHASVSDYHTSGAWNALGVAALGCRLRGHTPDQLINALGIAEYHGPRSQMMREIDHPSMLHDGSGLGAQTGMTATFLAERGFTGGFAVTVHDPALRPIWQDLGECWTLSDNYIKPYPICRWAHGAIDAARKLRLDHDLRSEQIARITIRTFAEASRLFNDVPTTVTEAQYSLAYGTALMLTQGHIGPDDVMMDRQVTAETKRLISATSVDITAHHQASFPARRQSDVAITLKNGACLESGDVQARGGLEDPLSSAEVREKFDIYTAHHLTAAQQECMWSRIMALPDSDASLSDMVDDLYK